ncbi:MAG: signal peptidase [Klenkia sp.]|nr:signal peptidase [Klenkia sp.]
MVARPAGLIGAFTALLLALVTAAVVGVLPVQLMRTSSGSMSPAVPAGALVLVDHRAGDPQLRDVVTVSASVTGQELVKRVVALAGGVVAVEDGVLVVDGRRVCEPDVDPDRQDGVWFGPVTVPAGEVFLLGDDRAGSVDSRVFGTVPTSALTGRVLARMWPDPGTVEDGLC